MSFRQTFTRNSNSSQNLRYDDSASYHFLITIIIIIALPLAYSIINVILNPFKHISTIDELQKKRQFRDKIKKYKSQNKYGYITFKFILKIIVLAIFLCVLYHSVGVILSSKEDMKGFDPYQILQVQNNAPIQKIKKAYRKLALMYHPDRNQNNPEASARFILISKAYECLQTEQSKQKCLKYGNPDGAQQSTNIGIALPSFLIKQENHIYIMGVIFFLVVIILPIYLISYHSEMNKYDQFGMLSQNVNLINYTLNQQFGMKDAIKMVACCMQFSHFSTTRDQIAKLDIMLRQLSEEQRKNLTKKDYKGYIKKCLLLIDARMNQKSVPIQLQEDYKLIMRKTPIIIKSSINMAYERSLEYFKRSYPDVFVGKNCLQSLILFQQYFIQGKSFTESESYRQLDLSLDEVDRISKKKKQKKITDLSTLIQKEEERDFLLGLLETNRSSYIKQCLEYYPLVQVDYTIKVDDENNIASGDIFQVVITLKSNRKSNFCSSISYPFLKMQGWHLIVSDPSSPVVIFYQAFNFDELKKQFQFNYRQQKPGKYNFIVNLMPDCYFGLDIEKSIKYEVGAARKIVEQKQSTQEDKELQEESFIQKIFNQLTPQQQDEVSDKQDQEDDKKKKENKELERPQNKSE